MRTLAAIALAAIVPMFVQAESIIPLPQHSVLDVFRLDETGRVTYAQFLGPNSFADPFSASFSLPSLPAGQSFTSLTLQYGFFLPLSLDFTTNNTTLFSVPDCSGVTPPQACKPSTGYLNVLDTNSGATGSVSFDDQTVPFSTNGGIGSINLLALDPTAQPGLDVFLTGIWSHTFRFSGQTAGFASVNLALAQSAREDWKFFYQFRYTSSATPVPEPVPIALIAPVLGGFLFMRRRLIFK